MYLRLHMKIFLFQHFSKLKIANEDYFIFIDTLKKC
uniref:Uncharacterized protein n=1 Tax=Rhizophora mucronata TaxID=61149 RepID=A0A2P2N046_RHIMU